MKDSKALFTCYSKVDGNCQKLLQGKAKLLWFILLIVDVLSLSSYIIISLTMKYDLDVVIIICSAVILVASIAMFIILANQVKKADKLDIVNFYDFHEKTIKARSVKDGQVKGTATHFYNEFILAKRVKDYVFISPTKSSFYPIYVKDMSEEEYKTLVSFIDKMPHAKRKNI